MILYIFDFDDTIINNFLVDYHSFRFLTKKYKLRSLSKNELMTLRKKGLLAEEIIQRLVKNEVNRYAIERKRCLTKKSIWKHAHLNRGVLKTLKSVKKENNRAIIISKKRRDLVKYIISMLKISRYIDRVYSSNEKNVLIRRLMRKHNPEKIVFISDSEEDLVQMRKLNIRIYCFYNHYKNKSKMNKLAKMITSMDEILE